MISIRAARSRPWIVLVLLTVLALAMRFLSFFPSVIDHDESTYMLIADALRHGDIYLKDVIDTKPIGIFLLFGFFQTLFGKSILVIRIITALWVALTGWMLYLAHRQLLLKNSSQTLNTAPAATGIIFVFATSLFTHYGVSPNTEIFFALFTATSLVILLHRNHHAAYFLSGLLLGLGFIIKYVVLFDALALGLFFVWKAVREKRAWTYWFSRGALMAVGFCLPFFLTGLYYIQLGLWDTFYFFSFELSSRYFDDPPVYRYLIYLLENLGRFLPVTIWFVYSLWHWRVTGPALPFLGMLWGALVLFIILIPGKFFGHYFIQFLLPLSLLAGSFFDPGRNPPASLAWMRERRFGYPLLLLIFCANLYFQKIDYIDKPDYARQVAAWLRPRLQPDDILYTGNFHQIVYDLTGTKSPTPYIHRSLIWNAQHAEALDITTKDAFDHIFRQKPRYVLIERDLKPTLPVYPYLYGGYTLVHQFDHRVFVYERKADPDQ